MPKVEPTGQRGHRKLPGEYRFIGIGATPVQRQTEIGGVLPYL